MQTILFVILFAFLVFVIKFTMTLPLLSSGQQIKFDQIDTYNLNKQS